MNMLNWFARRPNAVSENDEIQEGATSKIDEMELDMGDAEIIDLVKSWENESKKITDELKELRDLKTRYWKGDHDCPWHEDDMNLPRPIIDNIVFECVEISGPMATQKNPDPVVAVDPPNPEFSARVQKALADIAEVTAMYVKMKKAHKHWMLSRIAGLRISYSYAEDAITLEAARSADLRLDPKAYIDERGIYYGRFLGRLREDTAATLKRRFPKKADFITKVSEGKDNSMIGYMEWWTDTKLFYSMQNEVLGKYRNPNWNWEEDTMENVQAMDEQGQPVLGEDGTPTMERRKKQTQAVSETGEPIFEEDGKPVMQDIPNPWNHMPRPMIPWVFISIFTTNEKPCDDTGLIEQAIPLQDNVNKRKAQIDRNADNTNAGLLFSGTAFSRKGAARADKAMRKGKSIYVDSGDTNGAVTRTIAPALPGEIYQDLLDSRTRIRDIIGVSGSSAQTLGREDTVRGKIIARESDASRVGGGITVHLEQVSDTIFNWFLQFMCVYYDEPKSAMAAGELDNGGYAKISKHDLYGKKIRVSVKEGSLLPEDPLTRRNAAVDAWGAQAIDPITYFKDTGHPNPKKAAEDLYIWKNAPEVLFPEATERIMQAKQQQAMQGAAPEQQGAPASPEVPAAPPTGEIPMPGAPSGDILNQVPIT